MQFKLRNNLNFLADLNPWMTSGGLHLFILTCFLFAIYSSLQTRPHAIEIEVIESPHVSAQAVQIIQPKVLPQKPKGHEVFGITRRSLSSNEGEEAKAGNTTAKTPDQEKLRPEDSDSLPIPSEEYLITQMPLLKSEVRIPYPPESKKRGIQGPVIMDLLIDSSGKVREATLVEGPNDELSSAAVSAVRNFQFSPALIQDKVVAVRIRYAYRFILEH